MFVYGETIYVSHDFGDFKNECRVPGSYNQYNIINCLLIPGIVQVVAENKVFI